MDKKQWEDTYTAMSRSDIPEPAQLLRDNTNLFTGGTALDIAMGPGHNAVFLAQHGYRVTGVDFSQSAIQRACAHAAERQVAIDGVQAHIEEFQMPAEAYDVIINFYFLLRPVLQRIKESLRPGGIVFFETYTIEQQRFGGPHNQEFLLAPNELLISFLDLFVLFYHERIEQSRAVASLIAQKPA